MSQVDAAWAVRKGKCGLGDAAWAMRSGRRGQGDAARAMRARARRPGRYGQGDAARAMRPGQCGQGDAPRAVRPWLLEHAPWSWLASFSRQYHYIYPDLNLRWWAQFRAFVIVIGSPLGSWPQLRSKFDRYPARSRIPIPILIRDPGSCVRGPSSGPSRL